MTNELHAPGPWMIGTGTDKGQIIDADGERVCRVTHDPTAIHNARLIAAAPELLVVLRAILDSKDSVLAEPLIDLAADAIRKAGVKA